jgi:hypothetical protein
LTLLVQNTWSASSEFKYASREDALAAERKVLDNSWSELECDNNEK